jgi:hypothetical protein
MKLLDAFNPVPASRDNDRQDHQAYCNPTGNGSHEPFTVADDLKKTKIMRYKACSKRMNR